MFCLPSNIHISLMRSSYFIWSPYWQRSHNAFGVLCKFCVFLGRCAAFVAHFGALSQSSRSREYKWYWAQIRRNCKRSANMESIQCGEKWISYLLWLCICCIVDSRMSSTMRKRSPPNTTAYALYIVSYEWMWAHHNVLATRLRAWKWIVYWRYCCFAFQYSLVAQRGHTANACKLEKGAQQLGSGNRKKHPVMIYSFDSSCIKLNHFILKTVCLGFALYLFLVVCVCVILVPYNRCAG